MNSFKISALKWASLSIILLISVRCLNAQPAVSGAKCMTCQETNGKHKTDCKYYSCPVCGANNFQHRPNCSMLNKSNQRSITPSADPLKILNSAIDLMSTPTVESKPTVDPEKEKMMQELKRREQEQKQKKQQELTSQLKPLPVENDMETIHFTCKITSIKGTILIQKLNGKKILLREGNPIDNDITLSPGDYIATGENSRIKLHYAFEQGGHDMVMGPKGLLSIVTDENGVNMPLVKLGGYYLTNNISGNIRELYDQTSDNIEKELNKIKGQMGDKMRVRTPTAAIAVRGTDFTLHVDSLGNTLVVVKSGIVDVTNNMGSNAKTILGGNKAFISIDGQITGPVPIGEADWKTWWED